MRELDSETSHTISFNDLTRNSELPTLIVSPEGSRDWLSGHVSEPPLRLEGFDEEFVGDRVPDSAHAMVDDGGQHWTWNWMTYHFYIIYQYQYLFSQK